jgi:hypothetical protein
MLISEKTFMGRQKMKKVAKTFPVGRKITFATLYYLRKFAALD